MPGLFCALFLAAADWTPPLLEARKLLSQGAYREAVFAYQEAAALAVTAKQPPEMIAGIRCELGSALSNDGKGAAALAELSGALAAIRSYGEPIPIAVCANHLALYYRGIGQYEESRKLFEEVIAIADRAGRKVESANAVLGLAGLELLSGQNESAEQKAREALKVLEEHGESAAGPQLVRAYSVLAFAALARQRPLEAIHYAEVELALRHRIGELQPDGMLATLCLLAAANSELKRYHQAGRWASQMEAILDQKPLIPNDVKFATLTTLAFVASQRGDLRRAEQSLTAVLTMLDARQNPDSLTVGTVWTHLGRVRRRLGNLKGSEQCHLAALSVLRQSMTKQHVFLAFAFLDLADTYRLMRRYDDAVSNYRQGLTLAEQALGKANGALAVDYGMFAGVLRKTKAKSEAQRYLELAKEAQGRRGDPRALGYTIDASDLVRGR